MPIEIEYLEDDHTVIARMLGHISTDDINAMIDKEVEERIAAEPEKTLHAIYDVTHFDWTFQEFIKYITGVRKEPRAIPRAGHVYEHFVGTNAWVNNLRTWWKQHMGKETTAFVSVAEALAYIRRETKKDDVAAS